MKIKCKHCNNDISKMVDNQFEKFYIGKIECPHCHQKQERYISHFDLSLNFCFNALLYMIAASGMMISFQCFQMNLWIIILMLLAYVLLYFVLKFIDRYLYVHAPFKKEWCNNTLLEDKDDIRKSLSKQFTIYLVAIILLGSGNCPVLIFFGLLLIPIAFFIFKTIQIYKKEKPSNK